MSDLIAIVADIEESVRERLSAFLGAYGPSTALFDPKGFVDSGEEYKGVIVIGPHDLTLDQNVIHLPLPLRVGSLKDAIYRLTSKPTAEVDGAILHIAGHYTLDLILNILGKDTEPDFEVKLTEKEVTILQILNEHTDQSFSKSDLLKTVWGFAEGLDTHTLETHIYRLRQKIEIDPANPKILITDDDGYRLIAR